MSESLTFRSAGALFALPSEAVLEVADLPAVSHWPGAPEGVLGVVDYRGEIVPVLDVALCLGAPGGSTGEHRQLIVVRSEAGKAALLVDEALELAILPAPRPLDDQLPVTLSAAAPFLSGHSTYGDKLVLFLDLRALSIRAGQPAAGARLEAPEPSALLLERARELAAPQREYEEQKGRVLVVVRLGEERFGISVDDVRELGSCPRYTPVPGAPAHLMGLAYFRGNLLRVVDLHPLLDLPPLADPGNGGAPLEIVIIRGPGMTTGLAVDGIEAVAPVAEPGSRIPYADGWLRVLDLQELDVREPVQTSEASL